uniref:Uncharacterized protein n=1 Tax=Solanum tuberosum TaxID=4113 RepID=M1E106_SOLTU
MASPKVLARGPPPRKKAKWVSGKGNGKKRVVTDSSSDDSVDLGSIQFTTFESDSEEAVWSETPVHTLLPGAEMVKRKRSELRSKTTHGPATLPPEPPAS